MLRRLTLVGYRGCGKTTVGRLDAATFIRHHFASDGVKIFSERNWREPIPHPSHGPELVLSTKGGKVAYLETPVAVLQCRRNADSKARPSLTGRPPADEVAEGLVLRAPHNRAIADGVLAATPHWNRSPANWPGLWRTWLKPVENPEWCEVTPLV